MDFVSAPEPVLNMLCHDCQIQNLPVSLKEFDEGQNRRCEAEGVRGWIAGNTSNSVRSRYGHTTTVVASLRPAQLFNTQPVDPEEKRAVRREIENLKEGLATIMEQLAQKKIDYDQNRQRAGAIQKDQKDISDAKNKMQNEKNKYESMKANLVTTQEKLAEKSEGGDRHRQVIVGLEKKLDKLAVGRAKAAIDFAVGAPRMLGCGWVLMMRRKPWESSWGFTTNWSSCASASSRPAATKRSSKRTTRTSSARGI